MSSCPTVWEAYSYSPLTRQLYKYQIFQCENVKLISYVFNKPRPPGSTFLCLVLNRGLCRISPRCRVNSRNESEDILCTCLWLMGWLRFVMGSWLWYNYTCRVATWWSCWQSCLWGTEPKHLTLLFSFSTTCKVDCILQFVNLQWPKHFMFLKIISSQTWAVCKNY